MKVAPKHDFEAKLRQKSLLPRVLDYVEWQRKVRQAQASGLPQPPMPPIPLFSLNLDLTTACNYRCTHCIDWDILNTGVKHAEDELFESLNNLIREGLRSVILIGGGEPTVHRCFEDIVRFLKESDVKVGIVTNGSRGDCLERAAPLLGRGDWIRLSLDAGRNDTFVRMHLPRNKDVNLDSICGWAPKIRRGNPNVQLGFSFIIVWEGSKRTKGPAIIPNIDEMVEAAKRAKEYKFTYISYKPYLTWVTDGVEALDVEAVENGQRTLARIAENIAEAKALEAGDFKVLESTNLRVLMAGNWRDFTNQPETCHMMAFRQVLSPLGLFHCPAKRGDATARVAGKKAFTLGRREETRRAIEAMLRRFDASAACAEITCLYNSTNWWIEDMILSGVDLAEIEAFPDQGDYYL